ncbi:MAG TPA: CPBP family intramembrane glutamic endopeptidase [Rhizomicrobium sp.]|nr:CPBP family intramembrane glutamic endopeptidase [Rhizomicrobium sp.]
MRTRAIVFYCLIVYALGWSLQLAAIHIVGDLESDAARPWLGAAMFGPGLVALLFAWASKDFRAALKWRPTWRMWPAFLVAVLVPTVIAFGSVAICLAFGWGTPGWFRFASSGVTISGGPWLLGRGVQAWPLFLANVAATGLAYAAFNALFAMGEELGWRGFLQGALTQKLGTARGIALLGLIWSFWHLPGLLAGYNYPQYPVLGAFVLFPVMLVAVSFFLGWLTIRTGTFWPAAIAHGAGNSIEEGVFANLHLTAPQLAADLTRLALTVLFGLLFWGLLFRGLIKSRRSEGG